MIAANESNDKRGLSFVENKFVKHNGAWWLFWASFAVITYTYIGFPILTALRALLRCHPVKRGSDLPSVSVIIAVHNEATVLAEKLDNTLKLDYPRQCLDIIVASDGSDDGTNKLVQNYDSRQVRLLELPRQGKNSAINHAVANSSGEILLFTDTDTMLAPDALRFLVKPFKDITVGGVSGEHQFSHQSKISLVKRFKRNMKDMLSDSGSATAGEGQIYVLRRELFRTLPKSVNDDLFISLQVPAAHLRLVYEPQAIAYSSTYNKSRHGVFQRKIRINTRALQTLWIMRRLFNPFEYGFFSVQLISHKLLRRLSIMPLLLILGMSATALRGNGRFYNVVTMSLLGLCATAFAGILPLSSRLKKSKIIKKPYNFFMNGFAFLIGFKNFVSGKRYEMWTHDN